MLGRLFRWRLALANGAAAVGGYLLFPARLDGLYLLALFGGVALQAAAGSALNQVLERDSDALMNRTRSRPLPSGELSPAGAVLTATGCLTAGTAVLALTGGATPALMGIAALLWYLAVYTPLKRRTPFALAIGALCGTAPPFIGWSLAGGSLADFRVVLLAGVFYLWQVPHFWLLQRRHADDYRRAGFPLFTTAGGAGAPAPLCLLWVGAMVAGALMLPAFGVIGGSASLWCVVVGGALLIFAYRRREPALFACLNLFPLLITLALCIGR